jgi:hypothetical protein
MLQRALFDYRQYINVLIYNHFFKYNLKNLVHDKK